MKNLITLLAILGTITTVSAQSFSVNTNDTLFTDSATVTDFGGQINLINNAGQTLQMKWIRVSESLPSGWNASICDPGTCHDPAVDSANFNLPTMGTNNLVNIHFYPNGVEGLGTTQIRVFDRNNPTDEQVLIFNGDTRTFTLLNDEKSPNEFKMFPNPAQQTLTINCNGNNNDVRIINVAGEVVASKKAKYVAAIDVSDLPPALYFVQVQNEKGISSSKKLIVR